MIESVSSQLLVVLALATVLGVLVGSSIMRIIQVRDQNRDLIAHRKKMKEMEDQHNLLRSENLNIRQALDVEKKITSDVKQEKATLAAQHEALQLHARLQAQRVQTLTSEVNVAEENYIILQSEYANYKANKLREVRMLKVTSDEWMDNKELPVLSKRVMQQNNDLSRNPNRQRSYNESSNTNLSQPIIASELDIPSLAESELPDSVEDLEFELFENDEPK
jgi:uncharacterized protein (DUF3084 family)